MTTKAKLLIAAFLPLALACGGDPNKRAGDARDAELASQREQSQADANQRSDTRVNAAEATRENAEANARGSSATKDRSSADAKLTEARDVYRAKATQRLEKLDARTIELKARVDAAGGKASTESRDSLRTVDTQRSLVTRELGQLPSVANDDWQRATKSLDSRLDDLEGLVKRAAGEVDKLRN